MLRGALGPGVYAGSSGHVLFVSRNVRAARRTHISRGEPHGFVTRH